MKRYQVWDKDELNGLCVEAEYPHEAPLLYAQQRPECVRPGNVLSVRLPDGSKRRYTCAVEFQPRREAADDQDRR